MDHPISSSASPPNPFSSSPASSPSPSPRPPRQSDEYSHSHPHSHGPDHGHDGSRPTSPSVSVLPPSLIGSASASASASPSPSYSSLNAGTVGSVGTPHRKASSMISAASGSPPPTHRASFPDPSKKPKSGSGLIASTGPKVKTDYCCSRDKEISLGEDVHIVDAFKTTEGGKASYITYVIQLGTHTTRRRYSAFLSLHQALTGLYPVLIIPPIPSKQSLTDYAVKGQTKAKEDATVIARRKRLLEDFLRRVLRHPILGGEHVVHRFLEDGVSWTEVLHSPPISLLPKNPLHAPSHNPTFQPSSPTSDHSPTSATTPAPSTASSNSYIAHHLLPTPSTSHPLKQPDQRFIDSEVFTEKFQNHFSGTMEKVNRRVTKRWTERAGDMSELGAVWNGFSLVEQGKLGEAIEKVGQAVDQEYLATAALLQAWERSTTEPLHIYSQFAALIRQRLSFRHQKHVQYELVQEALETQKDKLDLLENAEKEARRLEEALERGGRGLSSSEHIQAQAQHEAQERQERERERSRTRSGAGAGQGFGLLSAVKHSLSGMMDVDPEATRRANIGKTRDNISQLEDSLQASAQDLKYASTTLQADLDRFQRQKVADLRNLAIQLSKVHREWCKQNLEAWQAAQAAIREVDSHPNQPPTSAQPAVQDTLGGPSNLPGSASSNTMTMKMGDMRAEIDRIEAANKPLPLPERDEDTPFGENNENDNEEDGTPTKGKGKQAGPLGPL
ncbi:sorting nexin-41 [Kwoniella dejecticola CBS 10117]|uniref:Sorting nexin-41 n=1 Tax=Kwoniella dejecticola CBS 10117 TaxID=1296121 RepID=A0A1A6AHC6_9TREE|nr:sorting nexin-41 [Kwoniella dejecticola CBS 10117]OBR89461.1 sorting nexin-41 [Kwoniella dejecticola CBS 10117]